MSYQTFFLDKENPGTFTASGGSPINLTSAQSVDFALNSSVTTGNSDGHKAVQAVLVDDMVGNFTINLSDGKMAAGFTPGDAGVLALKAVVRENTGGAGGDTVFTITIDNAVVTDASGSNPRSGEGSGTVTFQALDAGDGTIWSIA